MSTPNESDSAPSFAESALALGGKSADEVRRTGAIDRADDQVEQLFRPENQTAASPIHRAVWERDFPLSLFQPVAIKTPANVQKVMDEAFAVLQRHRTQKTLWNEHGKAADNVLRDLGDVGFWGLLVDKKYGGSGSPFPCFAAFLSRLAAWESGFAGLASVHGCIGAVDPVRTFGTDAQKDRFLPALASGAKLSAFALTEPGAGSDLTALRTVAVRDGNEFVIDGEKLFITNVAPGRTIGLVCLLEGKPAVIICELPEQENEHFQLTTYGLYALRHLYNRGILFRGFRVPVENLLTSPHGGGLTIAYHGLNMGRVSLCASAAGNLRQMLGSLVPWVKYRATYGAVIGQRELVQRRIGRLAGLIVACDALTAWCAGLLEQGFRGEMECIMAKIFGSEALKEAATEILMKTHGGRSFLQGHLFGDNIHEYLAPCIYEGEGEMLGMAFFKSLVKQHGSTFFEPIGQALKAAGIRRINPWNPAHWWALRAAGTPYAKWLLRQTIQAGTRPELPAMPDTLRRHVDFAIAKLKHSARDISGVMRKHQLQLADRQCRISEVSSRVQKITVILVTALHAAQQENELIRHAADVICRDITRELTGERPADRDLRNTTSLGEAVIEGGFRTWVNFEPDAILFPYLS